MLSATATYLNTHSPKTLGAAVDIQPGDNAMTGCYAPTLKDSKADTSVVVVGGGEVYQRMIGPVLHHLGVKVHLYDPNPDIELKFGEMKLETLDAAPKDIPVFILSPNKHHMWQARYFIERGQPVAVEKPCCLAGETGKLQEVVDKSAVPTYWIDFNHMMGRGLIALAGGVKMPFMDEAAVAIEGAEKEKITAAIRSGAPLIPGKITKVTGRYFQAGNAPGGKH